MALACKLDTHGINPVFESAVRIELEVGRWKPERAPALFTVDDFARYEPRRAQQFGRLYHPAGGQCGAHRAG